MITKEIKDAIIKYCKDKYEGKGIQIVKETPLLYEVKMIVEKPTSHIATEFVPKNGIERYLK